MKKLLVSSLLGLWLGGFAPAQGQQMTEMFIPIGKSPGVSGKTSLIGEIAAVDSERRTLTISMPAGPQSVTLTGSTWIWLDRSGSQLSNRTGTLAHLQKGRKAEVRFLEADRKRTAEWVKVQIDQ